MTTSSRFKKAVNALSGELPVILLEIHHPTLLQPVRVVNDLENITSKGNEYIACAFRVTWPSDDDRGYSESTLQIDNVGEELTQWIEASGGAANSQCRLVQVLRDFPDDWEAEYFMELTNISIDLQTVSATLGYKNIMDIPLVALQYRPEVLPALF